MIDAAWRDKFRMPPRSTMDSKQQFRSGKPVAQILYQIAVCHRRHGRGAVLRPAPFTPY
jgi:hypothetical protein